MEKYTYTLRKTSPKETERGEKRERDPFSISITSDRGDFSPTIVGYVEPPNKKLLYNRPVYSHEGKMKIIPEKMEKDVFYLVSYKGEKFAVRKLDEYRIEFREVMD